MYLYVYTLQSKYTKRKPLLETIEKKFIRLKKNLSQMVEKLQLPFFSGMCISTQFRRWIGREPKHHHK